MKICAGVSMMCFAIIVCAQEPEENTAESEPATKRPSWSAGLPERQKAVELNKPEFRPDADNEIELDMSEFGLQTKPEVEIDLPISSDIAGTTEASAQDETEVAEQTPEAVTPQPVATNEPEAVIDTPVSEEAVNEADELPVVVTEPAQNESEIEQTEPAASVETAVAETSLDEDNADTLSVETEAVNEPVLAEETSENTAQTVSNSADIDEERSLASVEPPISNEPQNPSDSEVESTEYDWKIIERTPLDYPARAAIDNLEGWVEIEITINPAGEVESASAKNYSRGGRVFGIPAVQSVNKWLFEPPSNLGITTNLTRIYKVEFTL